MRILSKFLLICAFCLSTFAAQAGVRFITDVNRNSINTPKSSHSVNISRSQCISEGYTLTSCPSGEMKVGYCPSNPKYFKECCERKYRYHKEQCRKFGLKASSKTCGGRYACE